MPAAARGEPRLRSRSLRPLSAAVLGRSLGGERLKSCVLPPPPALTGTEVSGAARWLPASLQALEILETRIS